VKYEVAGEAKRFYDCHCSRCRKATGTGHASNLFLQPAALRWLIGSISRMAGGGANEHATVAPNPDRAGKSQFGLSGGRGMGRVR
jgi:hypothetical protein